MKANYQVIAEMLGSFHKQLKQQKIYELFPQQEPIIAQNLRNPKLRDTIFKVLKNQSCTDAVGAETLNDIFN